MAEEEAKRSPRRRRAAAAAPGEFYEDTRWRLLATAIWALLLIGGIAFCYFRGKALDDTFLVKENVDAMLRQVLVAGLLVPPMVMIVAAGGIDFSVGALAAFSGLLVTRLLPDNSPQNAMMIALGVAAGIGLCNGILVVLTRVNGAVVTFATMLALPGAIAILDKSALPASKPNDLGLIAKLTPTSTIPWIVLGALVLLGVLLIQLTPFGRRPRPEAARERETPGARGFFTVVPYLFSGLAAGFVGVMLLAESGPAASAAVPANIHVFVILAAILGGTPFGGGFGSVIGGAVAVILLTLAVRVAALTSYVPPLALMGAAILAAAFIVRIYFGFYSLSYKTSARRYEP